MRATYAYTYAYAVIRRDTDGEEFIDMLTVVYQPAFAEERITSMRDTQYNKDYPVQRIARVKIEEVTA